MTLRPYGQNDMIQWESISFVYGTAHETGHIQPKFVSSENAHCSFLNLKNVQKACIIYQSEIDI